AFPKGSDQWYAFQEYRFLLAMHIQNYHDADQILYEVINYNGFKKIDGEIQKKWYIFELYLTFAKSFLIVENEKEQLNRSTLKLSKFLNEGALYPKSQRVFMVHHMIVQILFLLEEKRHSQARSLILQLKGHINRQLRKEEYFRTIQFIRLLQQLQKADFQDDRLSNVDKYYDRLAEEEPFFYRGLLLEIEIIPYNLLWDIILDRLRKNT
ncbi:MAG: hypothetical protein AAFO82_17990, partial [Bacteroidota bacterium]